MVIALIIFFILVAVGLFRFNVVNGTVGDTILAYTLLILVPPMNIHLAVIGLTTILDVISEIFNQIANLLERIANGPLFITSIIVFRFLRGLFR